MKIVFTIFTVHCCLLSLAQTANNSIIKANALYKKGDVKNAEKAYDDALKIDSKNTIALYNKGNSLFKQNLFGDAIKQYQTTAETSTNTELQAKAYYNKAVAEIKQQQFQEALQSLKQSLKLNNSDEETRENLQKVLSQINKEKPKENKQENENDKNQKPNEKPLTKEQAEQQLDMLRNEEKRLQKVIQQQKTKPSRQEKDW